ncbi:AAA family ATPase [Xanthobacter versatilis]|uniref:AAA family ATPase n=1 Tax=Xanthobacter autotrophicus (strain ATCC BAA-1158 / Py2) TaxID=78245 RepID=UPI0037299E39
MIKVERIKIEEFRGIRDLTVDLRSANFAVCGPNGTGKSGIVDALEFGLTGTISRLVGKGRGALSVKEHGPHVNCRTHPEKAVVTLEVSIQSLGRKATITRNVKSPKAPKITPDDPAIRAVFEHVQRHPEFSLSRREIIKYVLAEPGVRAEEVQALLQLDKLDTTRKLLLKISNAATRDLKALESERDRAATHLMGALGIAEVKAPTLLAAVNVKRAALDLPALTKLEATSSIRDGLETQSGVSAPKVPKVQARTDIANGLTLLEAIKTPETEAAWSSVVDALTALRENEAKLADMTRDGMLATALALFDEEHCPVCETEWEPAEFRAVVEAQREQLKAAAAERKRVEELIEPIVVALEGLRPTLGQLAVYARDLPAPLAFEPFAVVAKEADRRAEVLRNFLPLDDAIAALDTDWDVQPALEHMAKLSASVEALPEPTDRDAARDFLTVGQERLESWRQAMTKYAAGKAKADAAAKVHALYGTTTDKALEAIYKEVEAEFRSYYRDINGDDESEFEAQLTPSLGKLGFEVDFYGKGFFPPGAYHSEGHQDGMGLCLYLALMKHLLGDKFTFAVLDDVLMSVDAGHRREVCTLLRTKFPKTQLVLTTHDPVWLNHMKSSKLVEGKNAITFRKWHVDHGPQEWKQTDVWAEVDQLVASNEIRAAAGQLRHYLEYVAAEWCARLGGRVQYRSDGKYELGDLLPAAIGAMNELYKKAKTTAQSWGDKARVDEINGCHTAFTAAVTQSQSEQWEINPAVHFNEWANLQRQDFEPVVAAFKTLEREFECPACGDLIYVVQTGKTKEAARCGCAKVNLNLKPKPKDAAA